MDEVRKRNVTDVDLLGDIINDKTLIYTIAQHVFKEFIKNNSDINFRIISGNHDMSSTGDLQKSAISVFDAYDNVECISTDYLEIGNITYVPYTANFLDILKNCEPNDILISHLGINEAHMQSGMSKVDKITMSDLSTKFKLAILGHYHAPQELINELMRLYYAGNVAHLTWNDKNEQKRFLIYDTETLEVDSIPITGFREYREYIIQDEETKETLLKQALDANNAGHKVRVRNQTGTDFIDPISEDIMVIDVRDVDITNRGIEVTQSKEEQLAKYLEIKEIPDDKHSSYMDVISKYDLLETKGDM
jgi:DNA repair exonuclease SbcCD nuclease subunit